MNRAKGRAASVAAGVCLLAAVIAIPSAEATVTKSSVASPKDLSYLVYQYNNPNTISVSGTTSGHAGDHVDLVCYYGNTSRTMATGVAVNANGSFSAPAVSLANPPYTPCRLRAIPSGTTPVNVKPFAGPRLLVGFNRLYTVSGGPNNGTLDDYYAFFSQLTGGFDYFSLSSCGVCDGYLSTPDFSQTTVTWWSNAALQYYKTGPVIRSEVQIDGSNAYAPWSAQDVNPNGTGLPKLTYSYSVDKKNGNVVIHESNPLVKCASATYPPTTVSCATFESAGVTDTRTMMQDHSGRLVWVSDTFKSTDGKHHTLDLLWDNNQDFHAGGASSQNSANVEYEFPGQHSYSMHIVGDTVSLPSGPGTIFIRYHGAPDGDTTTGRGAIVYDRTADKAFFRDVEKSHEDFTLHQTATVPAHGSAKFRFAYVQSFTSAQVASLAQLAAATFKGCTVPKVKGKTLATAKKAIAHAGCAVGKISYAKSATVAKGHVISERPKAGKHVVYGAKVSLVVSE